MSCKESRCYKNHLDKCKDVMFFLVVAYFDNMVVGGNRVIVDKGEGCAVPGGRRERAEDCRHCVDSEIIRLQHTTW